MQSKEVGRGREQTGVEMAGKAAAEVDRGCFWRVSRAKVRSLDFIRGYQI